MCVGIKTLFLCIRSLLCPDSIPKKEGRVRIRGRKKVNLKLCCVVEHRLGLYENVSHLIEVKYPALCAFG